MCRLHILFCTLYLQIKIVPYEANAFQERLKYENGDSAGSITTPCGCRASETAGKPEGVVATQYNGRVTFSWTDQSYCETGFTITRDGIGFTSDYNYAAPGECGESHFPQGLYDDLNSQPMDGNLYETDLPSRFAWPDGDDYAQKLSGNNRWPAVPSQVTTTDALADCLWTATQAGSSFNAFARKNVAGAGFECAVFTGSYTTIATIASSIDTTVLQRYKWREGVAGTYIIGDTMPVCRARCNALEHADCSAVITDELGCAFMQTLRQVTGEAARFSVDARVMRRIPAMPVGSTHLYCVSAFNPVGYSSLGYVSGQVSSSDMVVLPRP